MRTFGPTPVTMCLLLALSSVLTACGGGGDGGGSDAAPAVGSSPPPQTTPTPPPPQTDSGQDVITATLSGSVGDGPVVGAALEFYDRDGVDLASFSSGANADYRLSLKLQPEQFPLTIEAYGGTDLVSGVEPDFHLLTVVLEPGTRLTANLNPFSTLIVQTARYLRGGPTANNIASARTSVLEHFGFGLDRRLVPDPVQTPIGDHNVSAMVKTSEAVGETIRRTRDALLGTGVQSAEEVIEALAADLIDGVIDGRGAPGSDARIAAVATVVSAQVLVESLRNELRINGVIGRDAMDNAIAVIRPGVPASGRTASVPNTRQALTQAALAVAAAAEAAPDPALEAANRAISRLAEDSLPEAARGGIPANAMMALQRAVDRVAYGSDADIGRVNARTRKGWEERPQPAGPGATYRFNIAKTEIVEGETLEIRIDRDEDAGEEYLLVRTKNGSAIGYEDYRYDPGTSVRLRAGEVSTTVRISTYADGQAEGEETFEVVLVEALNGGRIGSPATLTVTLRDGEENPPPPVEPPPPPPQAYVAPTLDAATVIGGYYSLAWSHPLAGLDGGFDIMIDGVATGREWRTTELSTTVGPLDSSVAHCFRVTARYLGDQKFPRSNTLCVEPEPGTDPVGGGYVAPVLDSVIAAGEFYRLSWTHPGTEDGFDIVIDGTHTGEKYRTTSLAAEVGPIDQHARHCFVIEARYVKAGQELRSNPMCVDGQPMVNEPPTISGRPGGVAVVGETWQFTPQAADPENDRLTFSIRNKPAWAEFDPATGRLSGVPSEPHVGNHTGIVITVSDGESSASLGPFGIEVRQAATRTGTVTLSWTPPNRRTDGSRLDQISGYRIYQGTSEGTLTLAATIDNPGLATYVVDGLASGSWTFAITALDGLDQESRFSNLVTVVVD